MIYNLEFLRSIATVCTLVVVPPKNALPNGLPLFAFQATSLGFIPPLFRRSIRRIKLLHNNYSYR
jgi:hypothetical protein